MKIKEGDGMDLQKENNLIQEAFEIEADEVGFCLDQKWGDYENPYENSDTALAFNLFKKGWQAKAQAVPEGFVLIKDDTKTVVAIERMVEQQVEASGMDSRRLERLDGWKIIEAAVKAQEQAND